MTVCTACGKDRKGLGRPCSDQYETVLPSVCAHMCAGVCGTPYQTPACVPAQQAVAALLTHGLALRLRDADPRPLLTMLNSGQETAQVCNALACLPKLTLCAGCRQAYRRPPFGCNVYMHSCVCMHAGCVHSGRRCHEHADVHMLAQVIWNGGMRDELLSMLADMRNEEHPAAAADTTPGADVATSPGVQQLTAWRYSALKDELQVRVCVCE